VPQKKEGRNKERETRSEGGREEGREEGKESVVFVFMLIHFTLSQASTASLYSQIHPTFAYLRAFEIVPLPKCL
jgi:hypothetical protein